MTPETANALNKVKMPQSCRASNVKTCVSQSAWRWRVQSEQLLGFGLADVELGYEGAGNVERVFQVEYGARNSTGKVKQDRSFCW